ncbi:MAG: FtsQ-type POTRA domain-containing protein [Bryobacteraceae bacterium]
MARRLAASAHGVLSAPHPGKVAKAFRNTFRLISGLLLIAFGLWLYWTVEDFVLNDSRFLLAAPPEPGSFSETFLVTGVANASERRITDVFVRDCGRSIYLIPIEERRRKLLAIDWVKSVTIHRFWPNRISVHIAERKPVAFIQIPGPDNQTMFTLVDADGVLLDPQRAAPLQLPVLSGISDKETDARRAERVRRFLRLQSELGSHMDKISEIDVSDVDNLKVTQRFDNRAITLMLGNQRYKERLESFLENVDEVRAQMPNATRIDLRLGARRFIAAGEQQP